MLNLAHVRRGALALSVAASLAAAPSALASGGGGGGGGGGSTAPATPSSSSCAQITSFSNTSRTNWGDGALIQTPYTVASSCSFSTTVDVTYRNNLTGVVELERSVPLAPATTYTGEFDYGGAPFSTPYTVTLTVSDWSFNLLTSKSATITTRKPQTNTI